MIDSLQHLRSATRGLARTPLVAAGAVLSLALAVGIEGSVFGVLRAVVLRPLPYPAPERLVHVEAIWQGEPSDVSPPDFEDFRTQSGAFAEAGAAVSSSVALTGDGPAEQLVRAEVSAGFFTTLGIAPLRGRLLDANDDRGAGQRTVVIGEGLWKRRFGADPTIVGRPIRLDGQPYEVVGIAPRTVDYPRGTEVWMPLVLPSDAYEKQRRLNYLDVVGRLAPGIEVATADTRVRELAARIARQYFPDAAEGSSARVLPLHEAIVGNVVPTLRLLAIAAVLVLLVACANVAHLLLARAIARERELSLRAALGAGVADLARALGAEAVVVAAAGGAAGLLLATTAARWLAGLDRAGIPLLDQTRIDGPTVLATVGVTLFAALAVATLPVFQLARRSDLALRLGSGARIAGADRSRQRSRRALVVAEVALSTAVLAAAGLVGKSLLHLAHRDLGVDPERTLTFALSLPDRDYRPIEKAAAFARDLDERLQALPHVEAAGAIFGMPFTGFGYSISPLEIDGRTLTDAEWGPASVDVRVITPGYLRAMGMHLLAGRPIGASDRAGSPAVVLVNQAAAKLLFGGERALGHRLLLGTRLGLGKEHDRVGGEVVGIVADVAANGPVNPAPPTVYAAHAQFPVGFLAWAVRTSDDPLTLAPAVTRTVAALDPGLPVFRVRSLDQLTRDSYARQRLLAGVVSAFGIGSALLAAIGVSSLLAYTVELRRRDLGVRLALGARPAGLAALVAGQALGHALAGVALGIAAALSAGRLLASVLHGVAPDDPAALAIVALAAVFLALAASLGPTLRAATTDPAIVLREP